MKLLIIFGLTVTIQCSAQKDFRVMFYNVENIFDTIDNPDTHDDDFLPQGTYHWNKTRYWKKLHNISKVITMVGEGLPPALVGMCEVENDSVLYDLTKRASLNRHKYEYVITSSNDIRGMNVALLYQRDEMKLLGKKEYSPSFNSRSILHVTGKVLNGDTLDIFVCHFHSRVDGIKKTKPFRIESAALVKQKTDSLFRIRKRANIIIMGDFNDYPNDESVYNILGAQSIKSDINNKKLYNLFYHRIHEKDFGSYKYKNKWGCLDQLIISGNLLKKSSKTSIKENTAHIYKADFLFQEDNKGGIKPYRTYLGYKYLGGYSDHLPIYMDIEIKLK